MKGLFLFFSASRTCQPAPPNTQLPPPKVWARRRRKKRAAISRTWTATERASVGPSPRWTTEYAKEEAAAAAEAVPNPALQTMVMSTPVPFGYRNTQRLSVNCVHPIHFAHLLLLFLFPPNSPPLWTFPAGGSPFFARSLLFRAMHKLRHCDGPRCVTSGPSGGFGGPGVPASSGGGASRMARGNECASAFGARAAHRGCWGLCEP